MADFNRYLPRLLAFEGGFVVNTADPGGATNKGVTLETFRSCSRKMLGKPPTIENLRALTAAEAGVIYKRLYWDRLRADEMPCQVLAELLVDFYVNAGRNAVRTLQAVLCDLGGADPLAVDGRYGPATFDALVAADESALFGRLRAARIDYYTQLAEDRPGLRIFLSGWLKRANAFTQTP